MAARRRPDDRVPLSQRGLDPLQTQADFRQRVLRAYQADFPDFGPTLACEKLAERGLVVSRETLRRWLIQEGSWQPRQRRDPHRRRRARRACFGELVPMDTSLHDGTEGRGAALVRVNLIDDATSRIRAGFSAGETVEAHFDLLGQWLRRSGRPVALYTDRDSIFEYLRTDNASLTFFRQGVAYGLSSRTDSASLTRVRGCFFLLDSGMPLPSHLWGKTTSAGNRQRPPRGVSRA